MELNTVGFGRINLDGGAPRLSSQVLGVDIGALIDGLVEAKRLPNVVREVEISANTAKLAALADLEGRLSALAGAAESLRRPTVGSAAADAFAAKAAFVQSSTAKPAG